MMNIMNIDDYKAIIKYDPVLDKFRGEFIGLSGGADFYATTIEELKKEGSISLKVFLVMCKEEGLNCVSRPAPVSPGIIPCFKNCNPAYKK